MKVIGAFLAEAADVVEDKLNVQGGVLSSVWVGPERVAAVTLVILTQVTVDEESASDSKVTVELVTPSGDSQGVQVDMPPGSLDNEIGFAFWPLWVPAETDGRYLLEVRCGDESLSLPLQVDEWPGTP